MSELITLARPYARAVYELARDTGALDPWRDRLAFLAAAAEDPQLAELVDDPRVSDDEVAGILVGIGGDLVDTEAVNLIKLLAENKRLAALPDIKVLYDQYYSESEGKIEAELISAQPVDDAQAATLAQALQAKLGREVTLRVELDPSLLGGAVVRAGDLVIDGSIRGKLAQLSTTLIR